ncbi:MAG: hypothetical protein ACYDDI_01980 [Candidatus Acidiferrales bacterium]
MTPDDRQHGGHSQEAEPAAAHAERPNLQDPNVVLSLLEADQVVAAKTRTRFGKRKLSLSARALLWGLRIYVFVMLVIVLVSVIRALHAGH